jgi:hypothetical protein
MSLSPVNQVKMGHVGLSCSPGQSTRDVFSVGERTSLPFDTCNCGGVIGACSAGVTMIAIEHQSRIFQDTSSCVYHAHWSSPGSQLLLEILLQQLAARNTRLASSAAGCW